MLTIVYILTILISVFILVSLVRNKVLREIGFRNITRRKATTVLVILGSLIGTALIAGSLTLGDSFTGSAQDRAEISLGEIDAYLQVDNNSSTNEFTNFETQDPRNNIFTSTQADNLANTFDKNKVDGVLPALSFSTSLVKGTDPTKDLSTTGVTMIAFRNGSFGSENINYNIADGEAIVSQDIADRLELKAGDTVNVFGGIKNFSIKIAGINNQKGAGNYSGRNGNIILSPSFLEKEYGLNQDTYNLLFISQKGPAFDSTYDSKKFTDYLTSKTNNTDPKWKVTELKAARTTGGNDFISYIFLGVSIVGVIAGILLIINIYSMLAEERKSEMGTLRAIALTRSNLIKTFLYEGFFYSVISSIVGVVVGIGVGFVLLTAIAEMTKQALEGTNFKVTFHTTPFSWILSFCLGLLITFGTSYLASRRISKVNIVSAIRNLPDEKDIKRTRWTIVKIVIQVLALLYSVGIFFSGIAVLNMKTNSQITDLVSPEALGAYLVFVGLVIFCFMSSLLISKYLSYRGKDKNKKYVYTAFNLPPFLLSIFLPNIGLFSKAFESLLGYSLLLLSGLTIVLTSTIIITYNIDFILWVIEKTIGRISSINGIVKLSLRYSAENKFRTGLTILMFALVLFLVAFLSVFKSTLDTQFDKLVPKGGYEAFATLPKYVNVDEVKNTIEPLGATQEIYNLKSVTVNYADLTPAKLYPQYAGNPELLKRFDSSVLVFGIDQHFLQTNPIVLSNYSSEFKSADEAIDATINSNKYVLITPSGFGSSSAFNPQDELKLGKTVKFSQNGVISEAVIAGYLDTTAPQNYTIFQYGIITSDKFINETLDTNFVKQNADNNLLFRLANNGKSNAENLKTIQKGLIQYNSANRLFSIASVFLLASSFIKGSITILQGFLSFALFVGIAGIAIIMVRSVNERKQQIGMLRSLGFQRRDILFSFFLEASFIILLGILIGIISGTVTGEIFYTLRNNVIKASDFTGQNTITTVTISYPELIIIGAATYVVSIIFTLIPSYQASKLEPVEATNYLD